MLFENNKNKQKGDRGWHIFKKHSNQVNSSKFFHRCLHRSEGVAFPNNFVSPFAPFVTSAKMNQKNYALASSSFSHNQRETTSSGLCMPRRLGLSQSPSNKPQVMSYNYLCIRLCKDKISDSSVVNLINILRS